MPAAIRLGCGRARSLFFQIGLVASLQGESLAGSEQIPDNILTTGDTQDWVRIDENAIPGVQTPELLSPDGLAEFAGGITSSCSTVKNQIETRVAAKLQSSKETIQRARVKFELAAAIILKETSDRAALIEVQLQALQVATLHGRYNGKTSVTPVGKCCCDDSRACAWYAAANLSGSVNKFQCPSTSPFEYTDKVKSSVPAKGRSFVDAKRIDDLLAGCVQSPAWQERMANTLGPRADISKAPEVTLEQGAGGGAAEAEVRKQLDDMLAAIKAPLTGKPEDLADIFNDITQPPGAGIDSQPPTQVIVVNADNSGDGGAPSPSTSSGITDQLPGGPVDIVPDALEGPDEIHGNVGEDEKVDENDDPTPDPDGSEDRSAQEGTPDDPGTGVVVEDQSSDPSQPGSDPSQPADPSPGVVVEDQSSDPSQPGQPDDTQSNNPPAEILKDLISALDPNAPPAGDADPTQPDAASQGQVIDPAQPDASSQGDADPVQGTDPTQPDASSEGNGGIVPANETGDVVPVNESDPTQPNATSQANATSGDDTDAPANPIQIVDPNQPDDADSQGNGGAAPVPDPTQQDASSQGNGGVVPIQVGGINLPIQMFNPNQAPNVPIQVVGPSQPSFSSPVIAAGAGTAGGDFMFIVKGNNSNNADAGSLAQVSKHPLPSSRRIASISRSNASDQAAATLTSRATVLRPGGRRHERRGL